MQFRVVPAAAEVVYVSRKVPFFVRRVFRAGRASARRAFERPATKISRVLATGGVAVGRLATCRLAEIFQT